MDIDLETFLAHEKQRLLADKQRLSARSTTTASAGYSNNNAHSNCTATAENEVECAAVQMMQSMQNINEIKCNRSKNLVLDKELLQQAIQRVSERNNDKNNNSNNNNNTEGNNVFQNHQESSVNELPSANKKDGSSTAVLAAANAMSSLATVGPQRSINTVAQPPTECMPNDIFDFYQYFAKDIELENASSAPGASINGDVGNEFMPENTMNNAILVGADEWSKSQKELANQKELNSVTSNEVQARTQQELKTLEGLRKRGNKDDMEQWVSDTFYSYFPGFNNEYQKRQNYLRERQLEYQQNLLKHQQMTSNAVKTKNSYASNEKMLPTTARSNATTSTTTTTNSSATDKTDLEIIVNNPNYTPKYNNHANTTRPGSTRHKLLQDLRHTELSNFVTGDGVTERNRHSAEIELARKKDYQRELMQQIEEKRRSVELLREKERRQEEALTRRLQEQLKTMQLEEELEKEKIRVEKLRFNTEQNRIMREHLLAKLENDGKLLNAQKAHKKVEVSGGMRPLENESGKSSSLDSHQNENINNNKVYKYFSNSARHEYRRGHPLPANVELDLDLPDSLSLPQAANTERECFHLSDKVCPMCNAPLRSYESCCLRCQRKLSLQMTQTQAQSEAKSQATTAEASGPVTNGQSYSLICSKCERLYALCTSCLAKSYVCRACHRERNVCMNCRRTLCSFCLEEIASGRDVEHSHVNELQQCEAKNEVSPNTKNSGDSERSFKVLDVKYDAEQADANEAGIPNSMLINQHNNNNTTLNTNKLSNKRPPYSINIERNSIFHPDFEPSAFAEQLPKVVDKNLSFDLDSSLHTDEHANLERVRKETDRRLSRYLKNYGDLAKHQRSQSESRDRSTQTTPHTAARRDVVLHEEHNLSMPLLREMPRMTRRETPTQLVAPSNKQRRMIDNLHRRWEIPAVQKYSISPTSPPVLTQVGAIRKQLQVERLLSDDY